MKKSKKSPDIERRLEEVTRALKSRVESLEVAVKLRPSDYENEAKQASKKASEYRNRAEESKNSANSYLTKIETYFNRVHSFHSDLSEKKVHIDSVSTDIDLIYKQVQVMHDEFSGVVESVKSGVDSINEVINENSEIFDEVERYKESLNEFSSIYSKIKNLHTLSASKKSEISEIYDDINGYDIMDEEDEELVHEHVDGLKEKLESSYIKIKNDLDATSKDLSESKVEIKESYKDDLGKLSDSFTLFIRGCGKTFDDVNNEIKKLLPGSMSAGLSSAFEHKKNEEVISQGVHQSSFNKAIIGLILVSLIPVSIDIYFFISGMAMVDVIE